jgi:YhcH/YjgK/YiaL family protein
LIFDELSHAAPYRALGPRFAAGFDFLRSTPLDDLPDGRHEVLPGSGVVAVVQTYITRPRDDGRWEAHRHHADIQFIIRGSECIGVAPVEAMKLRPAYDAEKDVEFYDGDGQFFRARPGQFALFFPHDVHMPGLVIHDPTEVKKVVVKVKLEGR